MLIPHDDFAKVDQSSISFSHSHSIVAESAKTCPSLLLALSKLSSLFSASSSKMARARIVALVASALLALVAAGTQHCYYPDGTNADAGTSPCNTTAAVSACCDPRDSCTISGLCLGASGWIYRSSCTDQTWTSSACPSQCHIGESIA
jgi:hypothetical protein